MKIVSWNNCFSKEVEVTDNLELNKILLPTGNNNSYGDSSIPLGDYSYKDFNLDSKNEYIHSSKLLEEYMQESSKLLYGIPGKKNVTIAGAIASDVHGKDGYWGGSFVKNIESINLILPNGKEIECSRSKNDEIFYITAGGYGLTGIIKSVKFLENNLQYSEFFETMNYKGISIENLLTRFIEFKNKYVVGWLDLLGQERRWVLEVSQPINLDRDYKNYNERREYSTSLSFIGKNKFNSMKIINLIYFNLIQQNKTFKSKNKILYPLNSFTNTKNIAKNRKIVQVQFSIPDLNHEEISKLLNSLISKQIPLLCSVKRLNANETNLNLSFVQKGWTFAVDFSEETFNREEIRNFYKLLIEYKGKVYLAKDSSLNKDEAALIFNNLSEWRKIVKKIDPLNKFQSLMSKRLNLKNW